MSLGSITGDVDTGDLQAMPVPAPVTDSVIGDEQAQQLQREAMERQVHSQSAALDAHALHDKHRVSGAAPTEAFEEDRVRGESLTEVELLSYRGKPLLDAAGEEIGPISCVYLDEATGIPEWLGAQVGSVMGSQRVVVPVFGSYAFNDAVSAPYARGVILNAEVASAGAMTPEQDRILYLHFGIPVSTDRSPSGLPAGLEPGRVKRSERWSRTPLARNLRRARGHARGLVARWRWPWTRAA